MVTTVDFTEPRFILLPLKDVNSTMNISTDSIFWSLRIPTVNDFIVSPELKVTTCDVAV